MPPLFVPDLSIRMPDAYKFSVDRSRVSGFGAARPDWRLPSMLVASSHSNARAWPSIWRCVFSDVPPPHHGMRAR